MINIRSIYVKNSSEIIKATELLSRIGINIFSSEKSKVDISQSNLTNCYLIQDETGWRIQSHLLKSDYTIESLEVLINKIDISLHDEISQLTDLETRLAKLKVDISHKIDNINKIINEN